MTILMRPLMDNYRALPVSKQGEEWDRLYKSYQRRTVDEFVLLGKMLSYTHEHCEHGTWGPWLAKRSINRTTAWRWMTAAEKADTFHGETFPKTLRGLLAHGSVPVEDEPIRPDPDAPAPAEAEPDPDAKPVLLHKMTVQEMEKRLRDQRHKIETQGDKIKSLRKQRERDRDYYSKEADSARRKRDEAMYSREELEHQNRKLTADTEAMKIEVDKMTGENISLRERVAELEQDAEALEAKVAELEAENGKLRDAVKEYQDAADGGGS